MLFAMFCFAVGMLWYVLLCFALFYFVLLCFAMFFQRSPWLTSISIRLQGDLVLSVI